MRRENAQEFTEALGQVLAGAVRLTDVAQELGIPKALGLSPEEWAQRRLAGHVRLSIPERRKVVAELTEQGHTSREIGDALGVDQKTVVNDRHAEELSSAEGATTAEVEESSSASNGRDRTVLFTSETAEWSTPQDLFNDLYREFAFTLDVCANRTNAKCEDYFGPGGLAEDGLNQDWRGACWMNPPYGEAISQWVEKAYRSAGSATTLVCLVPARVDTGWWWDFCRHGEVRFLRGRVRFGDSKTGAPFPSAVVIFPREPRVVWWER